MSKFWKMIVSLFCKKQKPILVEPKQENPGERKDPLDAIDLRDVCWLTGKDPFAAKVTVVAKELVLSGRGISMSWTSHFWGENDGCDGSWNLIWERLGKLYGCYIEWCPAGKTGWLAHDALWSLAKENPNLEQKNQPIPQKGDNVWCFILARDGRERSNIVGPAKFTIN